MVTINTSRIFEERKVSNYNMFDTYKSIARDKEGLNGSMEYIFTERFARLFDDAILTNNKDILSPEQLSMINTYFAEADGVLGSKSKQLDEFLGGL